MLSALVIMVAILLLTSSCSFFGWKITREEQEQPPAGVSNETIEAEQYMNCINSCSSCVSQCKDGLYYTKATTDGNQNMCASILGASLQSECQQTILEQEAVSQLNKDKCLELTDQGAQQTCLTHVAAEVAVQSSSVDKCTDAPDVERCRALYYKNRAVATNDSSYCENISNADKKGQCQSIVEELKSEI